MEESGVYNSTTVSYENTGGNLSMGNGGSQRRPWNLSEMVSPPATRSSWLQWMLLMSGSIIVGLGLIIVVIGVYNQHYYDPESHNVVPDDKSSPPNQWMITLTGFGIIVLGLILLIIYCKMMDTNRLLCNPLSRTRSAFRHVTKPRYHPGRQTSRGANLLSNEGNNINPMLTQYNHVPDIGFRHINGDVTSEEKANLMANEVKEGSHFSQKSNGSGNPESRASSILRSPTPPGTPPIRPPRRKFSSLRRDIDPYPAAAASHYKPRHFSQHGYGQGKLPPTMSMHNKAPLASLEDITPSLRSSFASVMMHPPSDWGNSDESFDSTIMVNLSNAEVNKHDQEIPVPDSEFVKFDDFRISPGRLGRKSSLSSVQSAL